MNAATLVQTNGYKPSSTNFTASDTTVLDSTQEWLQKSTRQFFVGVNWDDQSPEVQQLQQSALSGSTEPLSLMLSVRQFMGAIPWDSEAVGLPVATSEPLLMESTPSDSLTLDDFSDLF